MQVHIFTLRKTYSNKELIWMTRSIAHCFLPSCRQMMNSDKHSFLTSKVQKMNSSETFRGC